MINNNIAIFSDLHLGVHQNSNFWFDVSLEWVKWFVEDLKKRKIDSIVFCGDFFHHRDEVSLTTLNTSYQIISYFKDFNIYMITGNHDCYYKDNSEVNSLSIFKGWKNVKVYDTLYSFENFQSEKLITFCPWGTKIEDIPKSDIIFGHFELKNFKMNAHKICEDGQDPIALAEKAPLIFSGHFHLKDEKKIKNSSIIYVGNPFEMDFGDSYQKKGYYILNLDNCKYEFIEANFTPKHIRIYLSKLIKLSDLDKNLNSFLPNNIIKLVIDKNISTYHLDALIAKLQTFKPNDLHVDYDINYNKLKVGADVGVDLSGVDICKAIEEFVNLLDINNKKEIIDYTINLYNRAKK